MIGTLHKKVYLKERVFTISRETKVLSLEDCGIRIYVPEGAVPPGMTCNIAVVPITHGCFVFPANFKPVSGIYAIGASCKLLKPITIEIQHCIDVTDGRVRSSLTYARAEHDKVLPPYEFRRCSDGRFIVGSQFGSFDCSSFTLYTLLMRAVSWFTGSPLLSLVERYKALLLYQKSGTVERRWTAHFIVIKNLNEHMQVNSLNYIVYYHFLYL